jgi:hypothetical protein
MLGLDSTRTTSYSCQSSLFKLRHVHKKIIIIILHDLCYFR